MEWGPSVPLNKALTGFGTLVAYLPAAHFFVAR